MNTKPLRIVFMGTPDFSVPALKLLVEAKNDIVAVYTQPPRPAGRGKKEQKSSVHIMAEQLGIAVMTPVSLKSESEINNFRDLKPDVCVVVAYGQMLPRQILDIPPMGCINIHASILPRWRGAAPIHRAIMAGDSETGISIMQMEEGLDSGPVLTSESVSIGSDVNVSQLHDTLSQMGARLVLATLAGMQTDSIEPTPQDHEKATYAKKIEKSETKIDWNKPASSVSAMVRGLYPLAWFELGGDRVRALYGTATNSEGKPGAVLANGPAGLEVACAQGAVLIGRMQRAGKGPMEWAEFSRGFDVGKHANLGKILN